MFSLGGIYSCLVKQLPSKKMQLFALCSAVISGLNTTQDPMPISIYLTFTDSLGVQYLKQSNPYQRMRSK